MELRLGGDHFREIKKKVVRSHIDRRFWSVYKVCGSHLEESQSSEGEEAVIRSVTHGSHIECDSLDASKQH